MNQKQKSHLSQQQSLQANKLHFIGIGGIGMSALARYFHSIGKAISGSDKNPSLLLESLAKEGIKNIWVGHSKERLSAINPDCIIYSTAVEKSNIELKWAKEHGKTILHRSDLLDLATHKKKLIAVSGTHGKTSTTAIIYDMLASKYNPSCIIGGILNSINSNAVSGTDDYFIIEADESDKSFLKGNPEIGIITNIEEDHLENYKDGLPEIKEMFYEFASNSYKNKGLIACLEDKHTKELILNRFNTEDPKIITYGFQDNEAKPTLSTQYNATSNTCNIFYKDKPLTNLKLRQMGKHNVLNTLAAFATGHLIGMTTEEIKLGIEKSKGVQRRFQVIGKYNEGTIIDDYAHHPTEIKATIDAALSLNPDRLLILLQPHQPIRLMQLWNEFVSVLKGQNATVFVTDTYVARGNEIEGINSKKLVMEVSKPNVNYLPGSIGTITEELKKIIKPNDLVLILGAGDITKVGHNLVNSYEILTTNSGNN